MRLVEILAGADLWAKKMVLKLLVKKDFVISVVILALIPISCNTFGDKSF
jgi:hypothetical protein